MQIAFPNPLERPDEKKKAITSRRGPPRKETRWQLRLVALVVWLAASRIIGLGVGLGYNPAISSPVSAGRVGRLSHLVSNCEEYSTLIYSSLRLKMAAQFRVLRGRTSENSVQHIQQSSMPSHYSRETRARRKLSNSAKADNTWQTKKQRVQSPVHAVHHMQASVSSEDGASERYVHMETPYMGIQVKQHSGSFTDHCVYYLGPPRLHAMMLRVAPPEHRL